MIIIQIKNRFMNLHKKLLFFRVKGDFWNEYFWTWQNVYR